MGNKYDEKQKKNEEDRLPSCESMNQGIQPLSLFKEYADAIAGESMQLSLGRVSLSPTSLGKAEDNRRAPRQGDRFQLNDFKLHALLDFTEVFNRNMSPDLLMERFHQIIGEELQIDRILFYFQHNGQWQLMLNVNCDAKRVAQLDVTQHLSEYKRTMMVSSLANSLLNELELDVVIPISQNNQAQAYVLLGSTEGKERGISPIVRHLAFAQSLATVSFVALQNLHFFSQRLRQEEVKQQLKVAGQLQQQLIPRKESLPTIPGIEVAWLYRPFYDIGGDYFDVLPLDRDTVAFCIADVSGKGIPASLQMTSFRAHFRAMMNTDIPLTKLAEKLNRVVCDGKLEESFITFFTGRYHLKERRLEYLNAGHNAPIVWDPHTRTCQQLPSNTLALGMLPALKIVKGEEVTLKPDAMVLAYTDGLVEYRQGGHEHCDTEILQHALQKHATPTLLVEAVSEELDSHGDSDNRKVFDDVSLLAIMHHAYL